MQEFVFRKATTHVPRTPVTSAQQILREGTPVSLISVEELSSKPTENWEPITFVLASNIQAGDAILAKAGSQAQGQISYASEPSNSEAMHAIFERVRLQVGKANVPLRSTQLRGGGGALEYHRLENSGRIAIVLYVAEDISLPSAQ